MSASMVFTEPELRDAIRRLSPFHHDIALPYGLRTYVPELSRRPQEHTRFATLVAHAFPAIERACGGSLTGRTVLDAGSNCGGFSIEAARRGAASVLGVDVVDRYLEQATFLAAALDMPQVRFRKLPVEALDPADVGTFDVVFCFGLLYHLEDPVLAMRRLAACASSLLVVDTRLLAPRRWWQRERALWKMNIPPVRDESAIDASTSLWRRTPAVDFTPTARAVTELLHVIGFRDVAFIAPTAHGLEPRYYARTRGTFIARR